MKRAVLVGTDFAYDSKGKLIPLEINTNVGWDSVNRKEPVADIFDYTELSMYVRENAIKKILLEGKIAEICKEAIEVAIPNIEVSEINIGEYEQNDYPDTVLAIRTAWSSVAWVDSYAANKEKFKSLIREEDFCESFEEPSGNLPNLVVKAIKPQYNKSEYPKFYKADVSAIRVPDGCIVEPAVLNSEKLVGGRIPVYRNWSLFVSNGEAVDTVYLGTYTKVCGEAFDESKLEYGADGALIQGRDMLISLDGLATQWPADALVESTDEILMSDGTWKAAEDLRVGDEVKSITFGDDIDIRNHVGKLNVTAKDLKTSFETATVDFLTRTRGYRDFRELTFTDGTTWFDTANSSYLVETEGELAFKYTDQIKRGDKVYMLDTESKELSTKKVKSTKTCRKFVDTYNVGLSGNHVFFSRGAGETSAFASMEHNDTADCITAPKSANGAFQTFISVDGSATAKNTLNIPSTGVSVVNSGNSSTIKTFAKSTDSKGDYVNPNDYSSNKGGFTGCWYPLEATNATWNINLPVGFTSNVQAVAYIARVGSADGNALNGASGYWQVISGSTGASKNIAQPVKFSAASGPCLIHMQVYEPSDIVSVAVPTGTSYNTDGTLVSGDSTTTITFNKGVGTKGNVTGSVRFSNNYIAFSSRSADIASDGTLDSAKSSETTAKFKTTMSKNTGFTDRTDSVSTYVGTKNAESLVNRYSVTQKGVEPTLSLDTDRITLPAEYESKTYTVNVTSNAPWKVVATSGEGYTVAEQTGTGNGSFTIQAASASVVYGTAGEFKYEGDVQISTVAGSDSEVTCDVQIYRAYKQFVAPTFISESSFGNTLGADCASDYYATDELNPGSLQYLCIDESECSWTDNSNSQRIQGLQSGDVSSPVLTDNQNFTFLDIVPIGIQADKVGTQDMTLSVDSDLDSLGFTASFNYLGSAKSGELFERYLPYVDGTVNIQKSVTISGSVSPDSDFLSDSTFSKTADNLCLVIGTSTSTLEKALEITGSVSVTLTLSYKDLTDEETKTVEKVYTIGRRPEMTIEYTSDDGIEYTWDGHTSLPTSSTVSYLTLSSLQSESGYKLVATSGVTVTDMNVESMLNVKHTGEEWMDLQDLSNGILIVNVPENTVSDTKIRGVALVPANSAVSVLPETDDICMNDTVKCYAWLTILQDAVVEALAENSITVECNPREVTWVTDDEVQAGGRKYRTEVSYDITASAASVVSSSVSLTLTPKPVGSLNVSGTDSPYGTGSATVTINYGNSKSVSVPIRFGWCNYSSEDYYGEPMPSIGILGVGQISPKFDSTFEYSIGSVEAHDIPSLGGTDTLILTESEMLGFVIASYDLTGLGYSVSSSIADLTCSLVTIGGTRKRTTIQFSTGSNLIMSGTTGSITLKRDGKFIAGRRVQVGESLVLNNLKASPSKITGSLEPISRIVQLYTGSGLSLNSLTADSITSSSNWITVGSKVTSGYPITTTSASYARSGSVTFSIRNVGSVVVPVTQSIVDNTVKVWYCPSGGTEVQVGSSNLTLLHGAAYYVQSSKIYDFKFRYSNPRGASFLPKFLAKSGETAGTSMSDAAGNVLTEELNQTTGEFYLRFTRSSSQYAQYVAGTLSFITTDLGLGVPNSSTILTDIS